MKATTKKEEKVLTLEEQIAEWKKEYKKIFKVSVDGIDYIWRRITRKEYAAVMEMRDGETVDERIYNRQFEIAKMVVLNFTPEEMEEQLNELAGLATSIADYVLEKSGFNVSEVEEL